MLSLICTTNDSAEFHQFSQQASLLNQSARSLLRRRTSKELLESLNKYTARPLKNKGRKKEKDKFPH